MFRRIEDFLSSWDQEAKACLRVFRAIPSEAMSQAAGPEDRDLKRLAWHIVESLLEMSARMGLKLPGAELVQNGFIADPPATMEEIAHTFDRVQIGITEALGAWSDADLDREDDMYGERWRRGQTLMILVLHQTHHRGQMTVLMRQAGIKVPEIYGPTREGWAAFGMTPPRV